MERHNDNASALAYTLSHHPKVKAVFYPGLESHQNHEIAKRQMQGFGGMIGFDIGTAEAAKTLVNNLEVCTFATSLGGVETLVQPVALMTHASLSPEERAAAGVPEGMIRLSVGVEDVKDIENDILQALDKI
jgi:cystathionine beta-lyase/cystathionine gamma-synthase